MAVATSIITVATEHFIVTTTISSSSTTFAAIATTSEQIIEIYTSTSGQGEFVLLTEERWEFTTSPTSTSRSVITTSTLVTTSNRDTHTVATIPSTVESSPLPSSAVLTQATTQAYSNPSLSPGTTAGIAVACVVAGIFIGVIAGFLFLRRRRRRRRHEPEICRRDAAELDSQVKSQPDHLSGGAQELATEHNVAELDSREKPSQMITS